MLQVAVDNHGNLILPETFLRHTYVAPGGEYWLDECHGNLVFHAHPLPIAFGHSILSAASR